MGMLPIIQRIAKLRGVVATKKYVNKAFSKYLLATNVALSMGLSGKFNLLIYNKIQATALVDS